MKVNLSDILEAFELNDKYTEYFLDLETGEVVFINDMMMTSEEKEQITDRLDEHGFLRLPTSFDIDNYDIMSEFVSGLPDPPRSKLEEDISGRGTFGRFKNGLRALGIEDVWYDYQNTAYRKKAIEWCEEHDLEWEE